MKNLSFIQTWQPGEGWLSFLDWGWSRDEKMSRKGNELFQAGQDSLLEQMETPWVNRFAPHQKTSLHKILLCGLRVMKLLYLCYVFRSSFFFFIVLTQTTRYRHKYQDTSRRLTGFFTLMSHWRWVGFIFKENIWASRNVDIQKMRVWSTPTITTIT